MRMWGVAALSHDASLAVVEDGEILFAAHAERYSRVKNDPLLHAGLLAEACAYGPPDLICWYERPLLKKLRHLRAGQWWEAGRTDDLPRTYLRALDLPFRLPPLAFAAHHDSHMAAAFATSGFDDAAVIVADSIGEFRTFTVAYCRGSAAPEVLHHRNYPHSLGLLYSAFTRRCGFRPNEDEYVLMGMAALGEPRYVEEIHADLLAVKPPSYRLRFNPHRGIGGWQPEASLPDLAASIQQVTEDVLLNAAAWARRRTGSPNLILMGGVALNCVANSKIAEAGLFENLWIFPNPGDAGSSVGAVCATVDGKIRWRGPYLGTGLAGSYPVDDAVGELASSGMVGIASGRAEFGPRALGNRSLFADPSLPGIKDRVNGVKGREPFRPFAPVVREEIAHEVFEMPVRRSPYMQFVGRCRTPEMYPGIVHTDGTSRVQTVSVTDHPGLHALLTGWEELTGSRVLLNTSLNRKGQPLVNTTSEAVEFGRVTGVRVIAGTS
jgi:carbamoyltransferase